MDSELQNLSYFGVEGFISGKMSTGFAPLMDINGKKIDFSYLPYGFRTPKFENLKRVQARRSVLCTKEKVSLIHPLT
jgi:hypothetical protein